MYHLGHLACHHASWRSIIPCCQVAIEEGPSYEARMQDRVPHNFKALSCTPAYLNPSISQFLHKNFYEI